MTDELWNTAEVAQHIDKSEKYADVVLRRLGIKPVSREPGRGGRNLYRAEEVRRKYASRPGRGTRTDLQRHNPQD